MSQRPLEGIRVLDLTRVVAGPFATAVLADLGATVIKVERPGTGDDYRYGPSPKGQTSLSFENTNRGKHSITLDVRKPEGRELLLRLAEGGDALVENFRSGFLARQGLGPDVLQARNPRLVVASLSGFGATASLRTTSSRRRPAGFSR
jgi:crotonobetainyl-CoA:carnitine CoA-transferase CaiB-like acyl-CoA transferase